MSIKVIVGLQWGDEGKGKVADVFSRDSDLMVRYQGGNNAGHTVVIGKDKFILHSIPSGILRDDLSCLISRGVVINPEALLEELNILSKQGIDFKNRFFVSKYAHVVFPYHKILDELMDSKRGGNKIGTTKRGIGPCYADKYYRCGIRMEDLLNPEVLKDKIYANLETKNILISKVYKADKLNPEEIYKQYCEYGRKLRDYIVDCHDLISEHLKNDKKILFEGAQGVLLDIDYGTYPYVTSSNPSVAGIFTAGSLSLNSKYESVGVFKAYTTRVGAGPFPTECDEDVCALIREKGSEYGASTGRPRRCGWLDIFATKYVCGINNINTLVLTKLDVLDNLKKIKICTGYKYKGEKLKTFPAGSQELSQVEPIYEEYPGWDCSIKNIDSYNQLPDKAKEYIDKIEELLERKINFISTGSKRSEIIMR